MAKKATIPNSIKSKVAKLPTSPTAQTTPAATDAAFDLDDRRRRPEGQKVKPLSVSLTNDEYEEIGVLGDSIGATRMAVMNAAIRYTTALYRAGKVKIKAGTKAGRVTVTFE